MTITGKLGDVMQESIQAARSFVRSRSSELGIRSDAFDKMDISYPCARGRYPQGWPLSGRCHGDVNRFGFDQDTGALERRYDRRSDPTRPGVADWWA